LVEAARADSQIYARLVELCDHHPGRLAGSASLTGALDRTESWFKADMQDNVRQEAVMVPTWVRGAESLEMLSPLQHPLAVLALGGSVGAPNLEADVVVLKSFDELGPQVAGKIVLFNVPMANTLPSVNAYGDAVTYRVQSASKAAKFGAAGVLIRSVTTHSLYTPHTGMLHYEEGVPQIPAAAITPEDADWISRLSASGQSVRMRLSLGAQTLPDSNSANVIAEIPGSTHPEEFVVLGAHLDSWDVGQGANDDGAGIVQVVEALRLIRAAGLHPKRSLRAVLYTNEENGLRGGLAYAEAHKNEFHLAAVETDLGAGWPLGWSSAGSPAQLDWFANLAPRTGLSRLREGGGADISTIKDALQIGLVPEDSHYFDVHHTQADTVDKIDPAALREGLAAMVALVWELGNAER
jgi:hypothetical protein